MGARKVIKLASLETQKLSIFLASLPIGLCAISYELFA